MNYMDDISSRKDCFVKNYKVIDNEITVYLMDDSTYTMPYSVHNEKVLLYKIKDQTNGIASMINANYIEISKYTSIKQVNDIALTTSAFLSLCNIENPTPAFIAFSSFLIAEIIINKIKKKYENLVDDLKSYSNIVNEYTDYKLNKINSRDLNKK